MNKITEAMVEAAKASLYGCNGNPLKTENIRDALSAALSAGQAQPVAHLVWLQGRRAIDDVEDYYEVARPGDKSVDGSDPFPVYAALVPPAVPGEDDTRDLLMAIENAARMAEQGILSVDGGQAAVDIRSLIPARFRTATTEGLGDV